jgi:PAS domain S-box-containing protein
MKDRNGPLQIFPVPTANGDDLSSFFDLSSDLFCVMGFDGCFKKINPAFTVILGYTEVELLSEPFSYFVHPDDKKLTEQNIAWLKEGTGTGDYENRVRRKNGDYCQLVWRSTVATEKGLIYSIARENKSEVRIEEVELFNHAPLPQAIYDMDTFRFLDVNVEAIHQYGYSREEFLGLNVTDIFPEDEAPRLKLYFDHLKNSAHPVKAVWTHVNKNGKQIIVETSATPVFYAGRQSVHAVFIDITERVKLEEKITKLKLSEQKKITRSQIKGQERERMEIGRELDDNINQQLTTVKLYMDFARSEEELRMELIERSEKILNIVINEIRSLSKSLISHSLQDLGFMESVNELAESYKLAGRLFIHFNGKEHLDDIPEDLKITLFRVIQEQIVNITKYADAKNVWINLTITNKNINLDIKDDGKGFDPGRRRTGLGLSNIRNRVDLYNGVLVIDSSPDKGCQLQLTIPLEENYSGVFHVLVAEDDPDDQMLLKEAFNEVTTLHKLTITSDGSQLLHYLNALPEKQLPSLIVLDLKMPVMDGLDTLKELQINHRFKDIPKIIYGSSAGVIFKDLCISANATAYLEKKSEYSEMKESIRQMLSFCR